MDEVHYLADRFRGAVWEEVIIGLAESIQVVALSATVSNAEEFGEWLAEVRGRDGRGGLRAAAGAAVPARAGRHPALRPVRRRGADRAGGARRAERRQPGAAQGGPGGVPAGPRRLPAAAGRGRPGPAQRPLRQRGVRRGGAPVTLDRRRAPAALVLRAEPAGHRRAAGAGGAAAGHRVHLLPGRLRRRRAPDARVRPAADHAPAEQRPRSPRSSPGTPPGCPTPTCARWTTTGSPRRWSAASPPTTPGCCPRSRSASRRRSSAA